MLGIEIDLILVGRNYLDFGVGDRISQVLLWVVEIDLISV